MALKSVGNVAPAGRSDRGSAEQGLATGGGVGGWSPDDWYGGNDRNAKPGTPSNASGSWGWYDTAPAGGTQPTTGPGSQYQGPFRAGWNWTPGAAPQIGPGQLPAYLQGRAPSQSTIDSANSSGAAAGKAYGDWKSKLEAGRAALSKSASAGGAYAANQEYLEKSGINASRRASSAQFSGPNSPGAVAAQAEGQYKQRQADVPGSMFTPGAYVPGASGVGAETPAPPAPGGTPQQGASPGVPQQGIGTGGFLQAMPQQNQFLGSDGVMSPDETQLWLDAISRWHQGIQRDPNTNQFSYNGPETW